MRRFIYTTSLVASLWSAPWSVYAQGAPVQKTDTVRELAQNTFAAADIRFEGNRPWDIQVHNPDLYARLVSQGSLGLGESYMDGWWDCQRLDTMTEKLLRAGLARRQPITLQSILAYVQASWLNMQSKSRSMEVIDVHYQLGEELFRAMLDPSMAYSCGYWRSARSLQKAQIAKFDLIARKLSLQPGMRVLDIGCGWGGFAEHISRNYGVEVVGITLSSDQARIAQERCKGLPVEIRIQDYRDVTGQFDRVVEIGMFEHVGYKNYRTFMEVTHRCLKPGGLLMLHTIGGNRTEKSGDPWLSRYIFPSGQLPSIAQIGNAIEDLFVMEDWHNFGPDYSKTLLAWAERFEAAWPTLCHKYDERFYRMWRYYLYLCAGVFRARHAQLWQVVLSKDGAPETYECVR